MIEDRQQLVHSVVRDPVHFLAFGFGTGLSPVAPGTVGSLPGMVIAWASLPFDLPIRIAILLLMLTAGIWLCGESARRIGVHDHSGIVWDEMAAMYLLLMWLPFEPVTWAAAFVLFRFFDILKPWPISDLDHRMQGGAGIMLDDVVAALYAAVPLGLGRWFLA